MPFYLFDRDKRLGSRSDYSLDDDGFFNKTLQHSSSTEQLSQQSSGGSAANTSQQTPKSSVTSTGHTTRDGNIRNGGSTSNELSAPEMRKTVVPLTNHKVRFRSGLLMVLLCPFHLGHNTLLYL